MKSITGFSPHYFNDSTVLNAHGPLHQTTKNATERYNTLQYKTVLHRHDEIIALPYHLQCSPFPHKIISETRLSNRRTTTMMESYSR